MGVGRVGPNRVTGRGNQVARIIRMAIKLSQRGYTVAEYTQSDNPCSAVRRMFCRDLRVLEDAGIPVEQEGWRYSVSKDFMKSFLK